MFAQSKHTNKHTRERNKARPLSAQTPRSRSRPSPDLLQDIKQSMPQQVLLQVSMLVHACNAHYAWDVLLRSLWAPSLSAGIAFETGSLASYHLRKAAGSLSGEGGRLHCIWSRLHCGLRIAESCSTAYRVFLELRGRSDSDTSLYHQHPPNVCTIEAY